MKPLYAFLLLSLVIMIHSEGESKEECTNVNSEYACSSSDQTTYPEEYDLRSFQTPPRNDTEGNWKETYQDMHYLVGYAQLKYSYDRKMCTIKIITRVNPKLGKEGEDYKIIYKFGEKERESNTYMVTSSSTFPEGMQISIKLIDKNEQEIAKLDLEEEYFLWDNVPVEQSAEYENGQKGAVVEMFGWPYDDIAEECEFLGTAGYMAVKVFPPQEAILTFNTADEGEVNPWWFIYQPVSYKLTSRMGTKKQLRNMINTCRRNKVRVYADAVINHMAGNGNDMNPDHRNWMGGCQHWGPKNGAAGSPWYTTGWQYGINQYSGEKPGMEFPAVPYFFSDFHCDRACNAWTNPFILSNGWLSGLVDLNTEKDYVRQRISDYLVELLSVGFSGMRIDAAKHIHPASLANIFGRLKLNLGGGELPDDYVAYLEVLFGNEKELLLCGGGDYSYGAPFVNKLKAEGLSDGDVDKVKLWGSDYPKEFPLCGYWEITPSRHVIGLDSHDEQKQGSSSRDMQDKGSVYIIERNVEKHRFFNVQMFTRTDVEWKIKLVLSSYSFMKDGASGFPDGKSDCSACVGEHCKTYCSKSMPYQKAYNPSSTGYDTGNKDDWKEGTYTRVHRDKDTVNAMRTWMGLKELTEEELYVKEKLKAKLMGL